MLKSRSILFTTLKNRSFGTFSRYHLMRTSFSADKNLFPCPSLSGPLSFNFSSFSSLPKYYTKSHEYFYVQEGTEKIATIGISSVAVEQLGEVAYVELPNVGAQFNRGEAVATVASVKAVGDVYSPFDGEVVEVNQAIENDPSAVNDDPESEGWLCKIKMNSKDMPEDIMDSNQYQDFCASQSHD